MASQALPPYDVARYGRRLWNYVLELGTIAKALRDIEAQDSVSKSDFDRFLQEILLPSLRRAFSSNGAFYADKNGKICFTEPRDSTLVGKTLSHSNYVDELKEFGIPLVIIQRTDAHPELKELGIQSLLVARLIVLWDVYLIGVYDGQDEIAYTSEDKKFLTALLEILGFGLRYGRTQTEIRASYKRYLDAQLRSDYNLLLRDSGDYADRLLKLKGDTSSVQSDTRFSSDDVYTDFLDAALYMDRRDELKSEIASKHVQTADEAEE